MKHCHTLLAALFVTCAALSLNAQNRPNSAHMGMGVPGGRYMQQMMERAFIHGSVVLSDEDGLDEIPGVGVTIVAISLEGEKRDTVYTVAGEKGTFMLTGITPGKVNVTFSMIGYETISNTIKVDIGMNRIVANLQPVKEQLDAAVIKEVVDPITIKEDTLIFNAAAVKTIKGEMAIDILEQMPGVEVSDNSVKVLDETVSQVYVDGAILFGKAPMNALNNIAAEEVLKIKSYQEYANKDPEHKISKTESKQRVLDIETKSKIKKVVSGSVFAGGGFDTDSTFHKFRYKTGGVAYFNTQNVNAMVRATLNNINDNSYHMRGASFMRAGSGQGGSADLRSASVSASVSRNWWSKETRNLSLGQVTASYDFNDDYNVDESLSRLVYFPNEKYTSRETESNSSSSRNSTSHSFHLDGNKHIRDGNLRAYASLSISDGRSESVSSHYNRQDQLAAQGTSTIQNTSSHGTSYSIGADANKGIKQKVNLSVSADVSISDNDGRTAKIDSTTSTITNRVIDITSGNGSRSLSLSPSVGWNIDDNTKLTAHYNFRDSRSVVERHAWDITDPDMQVIDTVNTQMLTNSSNTHQAGIGLTRYFDKLEANLSVSVNFNSTGLNKDERFPTKEDPYERRFNSIQPTVSLSHDTMLDRWMVSYNVSGSTPSLEMVRPRLDNSNLYSVSAGNPDLKQSRIHSVQLSYSSAIGKGLREILKAREKGDQTQSIGNINTLILNATGQIVSDVIANRRTYFSEDTYLPAYGYTMPAQSTLSSYENVDNSYSASLSAGLDTQINPIMCILNAGISGNWDDSPAFVNDKLTRTDNFSQNIRLGLRSNFSRKIRLFINASGSHIYSHNSEKDRTSYFTERISVNGDINSIFKHYFIGGNYSKSFTQGLSYNRIDDNILNMSFGGRFGPKNNLNLTISVHDLLNRNTGFTTSVGSDYVSYNWKHQFGRYVLFTLNYNFNQARGNR